MQKPERQVYESPLQGRKLVTPKTIREYIKNKDELELTATFLEWLAWWILVSSYGVVLLTTSLMSVEVIK